jgi:hypothetical protein
MTHCYVCGSTKNVTIHHMRDIHSKKNKKRPTVTGTMFLCRDCHDIVEDIVNKKKSKKMWYDRGYNEGYQQGVKDEKNKAEH